MGITTGFSYITAFVEFIAYFQRQTKYFVYSTDYSAFMIFWGKKNSNFIFNDFFVTFD